MSSLSELNRDRARQITTPQSLSSSIALASRDYNRTQAPIFVQGVRDCSSVTDRDDNAPRDPLKKAGLKDADARGGDERAAAVVST